MEKIWLKSYPPGVPAEINPDAYQSIVQIFEKNCKLYASRAAFYNLGVTLSYHEVDTYSRNFAAFLQQKMQLKKGDRLAIMLPNILQYPIVLFGALRAGVIVVNVNPLYTSTELVHQLNDAEAETLITMSNFAATVEKSLPSLPNLKNIIITDLADLFPQWKAWFITFALKYIHKKISPWHIPHAISFKKALEEGSELPFTPVEINNDDTAFLQYTGGTTGVSKGAILTHRNLIANIQQADAWFKKLLSDKEEIILTALPLYHIFSLTANCLYFSKIGGLNVLITNPRDVGHMIKEMKKFKLTAITGVNTLFCALIKNPKFSYLDFSELHLVLGGGMAVQEVVAEKWHKITGVPILEAYGLTETSPCVTINPIDSKKFNGTIGLPVPSTNICILDNKLQEVPQGEPGELAVKGPQVMKGYWKNPTETEKVFTNEGWLLTGDMARINEKGFIKLLERKKDMILVSGFNVYPSEVESVIAKIPGVKEVAVVGVSDDNSGEIPKAFIIKDATDLTAEQVIKFCHEHLTAYKVPKLVEFRKELPKSNVGKILKRMLQVQKTT